MEPARRDRLIQYLLGLLPEKERTEVEREYLEHPELLNDIEILEAELIESYQEGRLSIEERTAFEEHYRGTAEAESKLQLTQSLRARFRPGHVPRRVLMWAGWAASIVIVFSGIYLWRTNSPLSVTLHPGSTLRSVEESQQLLTIPKHGGVLRLQLDLTGIDASKIRRATLESADDDATVWSEIVQIRADSAHAELFIQSSVFEPHHYILSLQGSQAETLASYVFLVRR